MYVVCELTDFLQVPLDAASINASVVSFRELDERIRDNFSDVLLATMTLLYKEYEREKEKIRSLGAYNAQAAEQIRRDVRCCSALWIALRSLCSVCPRCFYLLAPTCTCPNLGAQAQRAMEELQHKAKALITFLGMVQFRMPLDTHSRCAHSLVLCSVG